MPVWFDEDDEDILQRISKSIIMRIVFLGIFIITIISMYIIVDCYINNISKQCTTLSVVSIIMIVPGVLILILIAYYRLCKHKKPIVQEEEHTVHTVHTNPMKETKEKESTQNHISLDMPITGSTKPTNLVIKNPMLEESLRRSSSKDSISSKRSLESIDSSPRRSRSSSKDSASPKRNKKYKDDGPIFSIENPM